LWSWPAEGRHLRAQPLIGRNDPVTDSETVWTRLLNGCVPDCADAIGEPAATVVLRHEPGHHGVNVCPVAPQAVRSACATPTNFGRDEDCGKHQKPDQGRQDEPMPVDPTGTVCRIDQHCCDSTRPTTFLYAADRASLSPLTSAAMSARNFRIECTSVVSGLGGAPAALPGVDAGRCRRRTGRGSGRCGGTAGPRSGRPARGGAVRLGAGRFGLTAAVKLGGRPFGELRPALAWRDDLRENGGRARRRSGLAGKGKELLVPRLHP